MTASRLVLFDLDYTLLPVDSDYQWEDFLASVRHVEDLEEVPVSDQSMMARDHRAEFDIEDAATFSTRSLAGYSSYDLALWHEAFMAQVIRPVITPAAVQLVQQHLFAGDLCAIVTATNHFVAAPIARAFGVPHLIATLPEYVTGRYTGRVVGRPNYQAGKIVRVNSWLASLDLKLAHFAETFFYSDSIHDLPLLETVKQPIATNPSRALRDIAHMRGWQVLDLFPQMQDERY